MNFLITKFKIFEKTSLLSIGVPFSVMKSVQKNYAISDDAKWEVLRLKRNIISALKKSKNTLIISVCKDKLFVIFSYNKEYFIETYAMLNKDDFGNDQWQKIDRISTTLEDAVRRIERGCKSYELVSGNWSQEYFYNRKIKKQEFDFEETTNNFKRDFAENFTKIVKQLYGRKADVIIGIIINHLKNVNQNLTNAQIREILFLNVKRAKDVDVFKSRQKNKDPFKLYNNLIMANSLTIFDQYLLKFESDYSDKYKEYLNIPIMIDRWSRDKIFTAFMYYLHTEKLIEL